MRRICATALAALAIMAPGGCGGDDDPESAIEVEEPNLEALVDYFPDDAFQMSAVDLVSLRAELGLPANANPAEYPVDPPDMTDAQTLFLAGAIQSLPYAQFAQAESFDPAKTPLSTAIDHSRATAAANAHTPEGFLAVIATDQPIDEVAEALADDGWARDGDVLESPERKDAVRFAAEAEEGEIVVATERAQIDEVLAGENDGNPAGATMGGVAGSVRFAMSSALSDDPCVNAIAGGGTARPDRGTVLIEDGDDPDPAVVEDVISDARNVEFEQPEAIANLIRIAFTRSAASPGLAVGQAERSLSGLVFEPCP